MRHLSVIIVLVGVLASAVFADTGQATLDLRGAIALAGQKNPSVLSAERNADASRAKLSAARSANGVNLSIKSNYGYVSKDTMFGGTPILEKNTLTESLVLEKPIYTGGKIGASISAAGHGVTAAGEAVGASKDAVVVRVADAYFSARMARENIAAAKESVKALEASRDAAGKLREAGVVTKSDVLRSDVELASAKERLISSENNYKIALAALKTAIGLDQSTPVQIAESPTDTVPFDAAKLEPRERHDVSGMKAMVAASVSQVKVARSGNKPQVFAEIDALNIAQGAEFPRQSNTLGVGVGVRIPLFDSGATKASVDEARAMHAKAEEDLRGLVQMTELQTESARLSLDSAIARQDLTDAQVQSAEESLRVLQAGYNEGMTPITDVLVAQSALVNARFQRAATGYDVDMARVRMLAALGRTDILEQ
jgi:outer membrane protein